MSEVFEFTKEYLDVESSVIDEVYFNENDNTAVLDVNDWLYLYSNVQASDIGDLLNSDSVGAYYNQVFKEKFGPAEKLGHYTDWDGVNVPVYKDQSTPTTPKGLVITGETKTYHGAVNSLRETAGAYAGSYVGPHLTVAADNVYAFPGGRLETVRTETGLDSVLTLDSDGPTREFSLNPVPPVFDQSVSGAPIAVSDEPTKEYSLKALPDVGIEPVTEDDDSVSIRVHFTLKGHEDNVYKYDADATNVDDAIEELHDYVSLIGTTGRVKKVVVKF
jgi:hypothetical protein